MYLAEAVVDCYLYICKFNTRLGVIDNLEIDTLDNVNMFIFYTKVKNLRALPCGSTYKSLILCYLPSSMQTH